ncbi:MAG: hypothetical protein ACXQTG_04585 [Methanoculleaceae archaeon]
MGDIEKGFNALIERMKAVNEEREQLTADIKEKEVDLLKRMIRDAAQFAPEIGLTLLKKGKQDPSSNIYDPEYYEDRMIVLGKTDPFQFRPDDVTKRVDHQICVLSEDGHLYEVMYSSDGFIIDSYRQPLGIEDSFEIYGYDLMFMLYRALKEHLENEEKLLEALRITLEYISSI